MNRLDNSKFKSVTRPKNLSNQIEEQILNAINNRVFAVGDYLPSENKLVELFKVSRGVIREALFMLSAKGIIEVQKGKGAMVVNPSIKPLLDPFSSLVNYKCGTSGLKYSLDVRVMIEPQIASLAAELRSEEDLIKLRQCYLNMEKYKNDRKLFTFYDIEFHKMISVSSGNPIFNIILEPIFHFLQTYHQASNESLNTDQITFDYHQKILNAIEQKDSDNAFKFMKEHLIIGQKYVNEHFKYRN